VYELHRGFKNKALMASRSEELALRRSEVCIQETKAAKLELEKDRISLELKDAEAELEDLRVKLHNEQQITSDAIRQHKLLTSNSRKVLSEEREQVKLLTAALEKERLALKEATERAAKKDLLQQQIKDLEGVLQERKGDIRQVLSEKQELVTHIAHLERELEDTKRELRSVVSRQDLDMGDYDVRLRVLLAKLQATDEELSASK
jgi:chromosome segregation ATPase